MSPADSIRQRIRALRKGRGWSARALAEQCARAGAFQIDRGMIANIEGGRRKGITVDELFVLALVLDVAPVHLLVPVDDAPCRLAPTTTISSSGARAWVRGFAAAPGQDKQQFLAAMPDDEIAQFGPINMPEAS